jgi:hypothetical protein
MDESGNLELENRYLIRAMVAPLIALSFLIVGCHWLRLVAGSTAVEVLGMLGFAFCIGSGLYYLFLIPERGAARVALVVVYIPVMPFVMWWYGLLFGLLVLGVGP